MKSTKELKKIMNREERKAYKASERAKLEGHYVFVTRETPKIKNTYPNHTKLVSRSKAADIVHGKFNETLGIRVFTGKHKMKIIEIV